ncbi:hypothetical protein SAMN04488136_13030 [Vibrio xiamenensis]|uniref:Uncharacterized protein n=1 Tax=Vibrio xiamenensis TaxID=861298 RepID=A0A1G8FF68_9VIBR|nr:hypothetical protein [Vibrio xiamenensis]SDH80745.1 hypothetical protein SAMN04488136_13030 [Vibrio xiamenensis]
MFVFEDSKCCGSFIASIPTIWEPKPYLTVYFGKTQFDDPEYVAKEFAKLFLQKYYGQVRGAMVLNVRKFIERLQPGCGVTVSVRNVRSKPTIVSTWSELVVNDSDDYKAVRRKKQTSFNPDDKLEKLHSASIDAAFIRASTTFSLLDESVRHLEFDLDVIR